MKSPRYWCCGFFPNIRNFGKSSALSAGFKKATGNIIFTLDADLQDDPAEVPKFLEKL
ncbi:glycosyltransferase, partial [Okeania sp. SIO2F5]|uniref:glycosyltransferase n=1 Tax=Okeania sp. SIO2F5 TaxID=2607794 RepID=UPI00257BF990